MARSKPLSPAELKSFRSKVAQLKKKKLISKTDARGAQPNFIRSGPTGARKTLAQWVSEWDDVLSGKATAVKVSDKQLRDYRQAGYETKQGRVIIPHSATEAVKPTKSGIKITDSGKGIRRVELPVPYHNLEQWVHDVQAQADALDSLKGPRPNWGYKFFGFNSYATYDDLGVMFSELVEGTASGLNLMDKARESTHKQQNEIYQNLTLFAIDKPTNWEHRTNFRKKSSNEARRAYRKRTRFTEKAMQQREKEAARKREFRANMTKKQKEKYNAKGRKRTKQSDKRNPGRNHH